MTKAFTYDEIALHDRLRAVAREVGNKPALIAGDRIMTYAELDAASDRLAGALARRGVARGDRVTLFMPNAIEFVVAFYGALKAGAVVNPINSQSKEREVRFQVEDSGAKAVLYHEALAPVVDAVRPALPKVRFVITGAAAPEKKKRTDERSCLSTSGCIARPSTIGGTMKQTVARCRSISVRYSTMSNRAIAICVAPRLTAPAMSRFIA